MIRRPQHLVLFVLLLIASFGFVARAHAETWSFARGTGIQRAADVAVPLASGKLLVAGGDYDPLLSIVDVYDPKLDAWSRVASMSVGRSYFCGTRLLDGRVLVAGGNTATGTPPVGAIASVEIFDETTGTWTKAADLLAPRRWHTCVTLLDGRVFVVGGSKADATELGTAEIYDPKTNTWTATSTAENTYDAGHAIRLDDGRVLVTAGGHAEVWSPTTGLFKTIAPGTVLPASATLTRLVDGRVLIVGWAPGGALFDPKTDSVTVVKSAFEHGASAAALLPDGRVLVAGGVNGKIVFLADSEIFDPKTRTWSTIDPMRQTRASHSAFAFDNGRVLITGGLGGSTTRAVQDEIFNALPGQTCASGEDCASSFCADGVCCDVACEGACESCADKATVGTCKPIDGPPAPGHVTCAPYRTCQAGACSVACSADGECTDGNVCFTALGRCAPEKGICDGNGIVASAHGDRQDCDPYNCDSSGACSTHCATSADCKAGNVCDTDQGTCSSAIDASAAPKSGGCEVSATRSSGTFILLMACGALVAIARRRRGGRGLIVFAVLAFWLSGCAPETADSAPTLVARRSDRLWEVLPLPQEPIRVGAAFAPLDDGRIVITGGIGKDVLKSAILFDPSSSSWTTLAEMITARSEHSLTHLSNGQILAAGGLAAIGGKALTAAEVYDPSLDAWSKVSDLSSARAGHSAIALADGRVLLVGSNTPLADVDAYDPSSNTFSALPPLATPRKDTAAALLHDGRVIVIGGSGIAAHKVEIFDGKSNTWSPGPDTAQAHEAHIAVTLPNGQVLVAGGITPDAEVFDPEKSTWQPASTLSRARFLMVAASLPGGDVLLTGGGDESADHVYSDCDLYSVHAAAFHPVLALDVPRIGHLLAPLPDGRLLLFGGLPIANEDLPASAFPLIIDLFDGSQCKDSATCASGHCADGRCCQTACAGACVACDVPGKEGICSTIDGPPRAVGHATCAPYGQCLAGGCLNVCAGDDACDQAHVCDSPSSTCVPAKAKCDISISTDLVTGTAHDCAPYACGAQGACLLRCQTSADCAAGFTCGNGVCEGPPSAPDSSGCSLRAGRDRAPGLDLPLEDRPLALLALAIAMGLIHRTRRTVTR